MWLILQAIEQGEKIYQQQLHLQELGISTLSALFVNANRDPNKGEPAKAADFFYFDRKTDDVKISPQAADAFFSLSMDSTMPFWVPALAPVEKLRSCCAKGAFPYPRAWFNEDVFLVLPRIVNDKVIVPFGVIRSPGGVVVVNDPDSDRSFAVEIPPDEPRWFINAEFELSRLIL